MTQKNRKTVNAPSPEGDTPQKKTFPKMRILSAWMGGAVKRVKKYSSDENSAK